MDNQQLRNILKNFNFGTLTALQLSQVGGGVFADINAKTDMKNLTEITNAWRAVTNPSYGQVIPQTGEFVAATVADTPNKIVEPTGNEVYRLEAIDVANAYSGGGLPPTFTAVVRIADPDYPSIDRSVVIARQDITLTTPVSLLIPANLFVDSSAVITVEASGASLAFTAYVTKVAI